jgi:alpha-1,6-mannosyltransferase
MWKQGISPGMLLAMLGMATGVVGLGFFSAQDTFGRILIFYALAFTGYLFLYKKATLSQLPVFIALAIGLRFILVFAFPALSDDIYRFIWDGHLLMAGMNPFEQLPAEYLAQEPAIPGLSTGLFQELNSQEYFTIYPPIAQATFASAVWLSPESWWGAGVIMKGFLFGFECGAIYLLWRLLRHFELPETNVLLYALNPLIIVEITGNLHHEGMMIAFLLLALWLLVKNRREWAAMAFAGSIASKLLPLMFLPFLIRRLGIKVSFWFFALMGVVLIALFLPLLNDVFLHNFSQSLDLYFRRFEFNGSFYYISRAIGYEMTGYNMIHKIGPVMAMGTLFGILAATLLEHGKTWKSLPGWWLFAITIYLCFTPTVHPWYTSLPIVLCCFTVYRFPIIWSGLIMLTYINYSYDPYFENLWVVAAEYGVVGVLAVAELFFKVRILQNNASAPTA